MVTVLLEYLDLAFATRSWLSSGLLSDSSVLLQGLSMMIIPATHRFSAHCSKRFAW